jgi:phosphotransferase system HPr-like phosphotransfer protein
MEKLTIGFAEIKDIENFVEVVAKYDFAVTLAQGKYEVDGKSLMGIFTLDITRPIEIVFDANTEESNAFIQEIQKYIA